MKTFYPMHNSWQRVQGCIKFGVQNWDQTFACQTAMNKFLMHCDVLAYLFFGVSIICNISKLGHIWWIDFFIFSANNK